MTAQQKFDTVAKHLITQGTQAYASGEGCQYRGPNKTACAVGCLIPDDVYNRDMEGNTVTSVLREFPDLMEPIIGHDIQLLVDLQQVHDNIDAVVLSRALGLMHEAAHIVPELGSTLHLSLLDRDNRKFDIPTLKTCLELLAKKHNLSTEVLQ